MKSGFQRQVEFRATTRFGRTRSGSHQAGCAVVEACPGRRWQALGCAALSDASWTVADSIHLAPSSDRPHESPQGAVPSRAGCISVAPVPVAEHSRRRGMSPVSTRCGISATPACPTHRPPAGSSGSPPVSSRSSSVTPATPHNGGPSGPPSDGCADTYHGACDSPVLLAPAGHGPRPTACGTRRSAHTCRGKSPAGRRSPYRDTSSSHSHAPSLTSSVLRRIPR